jgi:hypothetical protein
LFFDFEIYGCVGFDCLSMSIGKSIKHDDEQIFETEQKTPDSGTYSRNIGSYGDRTTNTDGQSYNSKVFPTYFNGWIPSVSSMSLIEPTCVLCIPFSWM